MFKWFNRDKNELKETKETKVRTGNYDMDDSGNITVSVMSNGFYYSNFSIPKESIIVHTQKCIAFYDYIDWYNHQKRHGYYGWDYRFVIDYRLAIENKEDFIKYKKTEIKTIECCSDDKKWALTKRETVKNELVSKRSPLAIFVEEFNIKYKLIETVDEFNDYLSSTLDCDTWCRKKLYDKMKEFGLRDGFINQFADLVGNDLDKYHAMIDLANEVTDKDTLMYLYAYKFGK